MLDWTEGIQIHMSRAFVTVISTPTNYIIIIITIASPLVSWSPFVSIWLPTSAPHNDVVSTVANKYLCTLAPVYWTFANWIITVGQTSPNGQHQYVPTGYNNINITQSDPPPAITYSADHPGRVLALIQGITIMCIILVLNYYYNTIFSSLTLMDGHIPGALI